eukprot:1140620-Pelagomonas_calceolata.AAC.10
MLPLLCAGHAEHGPAFLCAQSGTQERELAMEAAEQADHAAEQRCTAALIVATILSKATLKHPIPSKHTLKGLSPLNTLNKATHEYPIRLKHTLEGLPPLNTSLLAYPPNKNTCVHTTSTL